MVTEPRIQYATSKDGTSIAFYAIGSEERATLYFSLPMSHLEVEWTIAPLRAQFMMAAEQATFFRFDPRGFGLSDRNPTDVSLDAMVSDIEAIVERLGIHRFGISALGLAPVPAIAYAARHPEQVDRLVLMPGMSSGDDMAIPRLLKLTELATVDWDLASDTFFRSFNPLWPDELVRQFGHLLRASVGPDQFVHLWEQIRAWNADEDARRLQVRTLLIHDRNDPNMDVATTRRVAALIPDAHIAFVSDPFEQLRVTREFYFGASHESEAAARAEPPSETAIILFADIVDSTAMTERIGDAAFRAKSRDLDAALRTIIRDCGGNVIDAMTLGDGVLATFPAASQAIDAALRFEAAAADAGLQLHVGLHAGDVIREEGNVFGGAVNIAARVSALAAPGEVLVSDLVRGLARTSAGVTFEDRGEQALKGVGEPVKVYAVRRQR